MSKIDETYKALIYLASCSVNRIVPDISELGTVNMEELFRAAAFHQLVTVAGEGLALAGITDDRFIRERVNEIWRSSIIDTEREKILQKLEEENIWYMPLKGIVLKDYYPQREMRQMSDNDILVDEDMAASLYEIMISLGYTPVFFNEMYHDAYKKLPVSVFEMHRKMINDKAMTKAFRTYYSDFKRLMKKDEENGFGFHLSNEDFYIYMITHEYKHYSNRGSGLRSLLDVYVFLKNVGGKLDWKYIKKEIKKLEISKFEKKNRNLALKVFEEGKVDHLSKAEKNMLSFFIYSGVYGQWDDGFKNKVMRAGRQKYIIRRVFLSMEQVKQFYPFFYKYRLLIPLLPIYRFVCHYRNAEAEIRELLK